jgi:hypothetical protein
MSDDERLARRRDNRRRRLSEADNDGPRLAADDVARRRKVAEASQRDTKRGLVRQVDEFHRDHDAPRLQCAAIARLRLFLTVEQWDALSATERLEYEYFFAQLFEPLQPCACCTVRRPLSVLSTLSTAKQPDHITQPDSGLRFCSACCSFKATDECPSCPRSQVFNLMSTGDDPVPPELSALNAFELSLLRLVHPFGQLIALPSGGQPGLRGQVVMLVHAEPTRAGGYAAPQCRR